MPDPTRPSLEYRANLAGAPSTFGYAAIIVAVPMLLAAAIYQFYRPGPVAAVVGTLAFLATALLVRTIHKSAAWHPRPADRDDLQGLYRWALLMSVLISFAPLLVGWSRSNGPIGAGVSMMIGIMVILLFIQEIDDPGKHRQIACEHMSKIAQVAQLTAGSAGESTVYTTQLFAPIWERLGYKVPAEVASAEAWFLTESWSSIGYLHKVFDLLFGAKFMVTAVAKQPGLPALRFVRTTWLLAPILVLGTWDQGKFKSSGRILALDSAMLEKLMLATTQSFPLYAAGRRA